MTVTSTVSRNQYTADGVQDTFAYAFKIFEKTDLVVYLDDALQLVDVNYSVTGIGSETGGNVVFVTIPASGVIVTIYRQLPMTQEVHYPEGDPFPSATHEEGMDRLVMLAQRFNDLVNKVLRLPDYSTLSNIIVPVGATKGLRWNAAADAIELFTVDESSTSVIAAEGDIIVGDAGGSPERLVHGNEGDTLQTAFGKVRWVPPVSHFMTNKSGGGVVGGDVVILDATSDSAFITTTVQGYTGPIFIVYDAIADDDLGRVNQSGVRSVAVTGGVARGDFLITSGTAKKAMSGGGSWIDGAFGVALAADAGGFVTAILFGKTHTDTVPMSAPIGLLVKESTDDPRANKYDITADYITLAYGSAIVHLENVAVNVDLGASGAGGLDTGSPTPSTWYYVWLIYDPSTTTADGLFSTSPTAPTMPTGYTYKRRVAAVWNAPYAMQLHMDGVDQGTDFPDETGKTWTANGNARTVTGVKKFGTASGYFDGTGDWIQTPDHEDFNVGSTDFTLEFWFRRAGGIGSQQYMMGQGNAALGADLSWVVTLNTSNQVGWWGSANGTTWGIQLNTTTAVSDTSTFHHVAVVRHGTMFQIWLDGTLENTIYGNPDYLIANSTTVFCIGRPGLYVGAYFNGYVDEVAMWKGMSRYGHINFDVPTSAYISDVAIRKVRAQSDGWHAFEDPQYGPIQFLNITLPKTFTEYTDFPLPTGVIELGILAHSNSGGSVSQVWSPNGSIPSGSIFNAGAASWFAETMTRIPWDRTKTSIWARTSWADSTAANQFLRIPGFRLEI